MDKFKLFKNNIKIFDRDILDTELFMKLFHFFIYLIYINIKIMNLIN